MSNFFRRLLRPVPASVIAVALLGLPAAWAINVAQITTPVPAADIQGVLNQLIGSMNTAFGWNTTSSCSGTTTATCQGNRVTVSITGLTTAAAGVESAAMTVTDAAAVAASTIKCQVNGYAGTGVPTATRVIPAAGTFSFTITNVAMAAALNATVVTVCEVYN